ncbi:hypothetical protein ES703_37565 [subsurface metagenome]
MTLYGTWNPDDKSANITLSNGNLTAQAIAVGWKSVRSTLGKSSGKWYWEVTIDVLITANMVGIMTADGNLNSYAGSDAYGYSYSGQGGWKWHNGVNTAYGDSYAATDVISVALDLDNGKIWWAKNGTWQAGGDPGAGTGEAYSGLSGTFHAGCSPYTNGNKMTANFGASAFSYSVPSGFNPGLYEEEGQTELEDASLNLVAYYQALEDLQGFFRAHDGIELHDLKSALAAFNGNMEDFAGWLAAYFESIDGLGADLETWATRYRDLASVLDVKGQNIESLTAYFEAAKAGYKDLAAFLSATDGAVLRDFASFLAVTDGVTLRDFTLYLKAVRGVPAFRSITAQRVSSVVHEVS